MLTHRAGRSNRTVTLAGIPGGCAAGHHPEVAGSLTIANEQLAENLIEAENAHDYERLFSVISEDFVLHRPKLEGGRDALRQTALAVYRAFPDHCREVERLLPGDQFVVLHWRFTGTHDGPFAGVSPTGRQVALRGCSIWELVDLRLVGAWCFADVSAVLRQLGWADAALADRPTDELLVMA